MHSPFAIDTSGHALGTDIVVADPDNRPALDEWVLQSNLARPSAVNRPRRRCRSAPPSIPRGHRVERVGLNGVVFNPFSYHRDIGRQPRSQSVHPPRTPG